MSVATPRPPASPPQGLPPQASPSQGDVTAPVEIDAGVIEEARRRQRRRRAAGAAFSAGAFVAVGLAALLIGGGGRSGTAGGAALAGEQRLALLHGRVLVNGRPALMGVTPSLQAGNAGVCVRVVGGEGCNGPYPTRAYPVYGGGESFQPEEKVGPGGEIDALFTGPGVAALRVAHLGTFEAQAAPGLPPGVKQIVFYRPPGARGSVLAPGVSPSVLRGFEHARRGPALTETLLDASGRAIAVGKSPVFTLPNSYWQGTQAPPARGRCAMSSSLAGVRTAWGEVATAIAADPDIITTGWFTCLNAWFSLDGSSYEAAILLDAKAPGRAPAMLWGARPLAGHPGIVEIPAVQQKIQVRFPPITRARAARLLAIDTKRGGRARALQLEHQVVQAAGKVDTFWDVFVPRTVARRVGPAWVLVRYGDSLAAQIRFLQALRITKIELPRR